MASDIFAGCKQALEVTQGWIDRKCGDKYTVYSNITAVLIHNLKCHLKRQFSWGALNCLKGRNLCYTLSASYQLKDVYFINEEQSPFVNHINEAIKQGLPTLRQLQTINQSTEPLINLRTIETFKF